MKRKGFTLVELLGVLTLIGLIAVIALPTVDSILRRSRNKMLENTKNSIITSARNWLTDYKYLLSKNGDTISITLLDLKEEGYIDFDLKNPVTEACLSNNNKVKITRVKDDNNNRYDIEMDEKLIDGAPEDCEAVAKSPKCYLLGNNPMTIKVGESFKTLDPGAACIDTDGNTLSYTRSGDNFTITLPGSYEVKYTATSKGVTKELIRKVTIKDDVAPTITGAIDKTFAKTATGIDISSYVTATDNSSETITVSLKTNLKEGVPGEYYAIYSAKDSSGNATSVEVKIRITE